EPEGAVPGCEQEERGRKHRPRTAFRQAVEAPRPLCSEYAPHREVRQLVARLLEARSHQVQVALVAEAERRPVQLDVRDETGVLLAARAVEGDLEDRGMTGPGQPLERAEGGQAHTALAPLRARERVPRGERVVHGR